MKFTDGFWVKPDQYTINSAMSVYKVMIEDSSVVVYAPNKKINTRSDTPGIPVLTIKISSPQKDIIGLHVIHHKGAIQNGGKVSFDLKHDYLKFDNITQSNEELILQSGNLKCVIDKMSFKISFYNQDKLLLHSFDKGLAHIIRYKEYELYDFKDDKELEYHIGKEPKTFMKEELSIGAGEYLYGFGERFGPFVKNGQSFEMWNEDGGTSSSQGYKNIPFYISNMGYGVFVNHTEKVMFEVGSEKNSRLQFAVAGEELNYYVINGSSLKEVLANYTLLTGKPSLPPAKSFGLWLSTSFCTDYTEATVLNFIDKMKEKDIPLDTFHFDCFWMPAFEWCGFEFDKVAFANPEKLLQTIRARGINVCLWINPYVGQNSTAFDECLQNGYFLKKPDGTVWQTDLWQAGLAIIDFTNPEAVKWYEDQLERLIKIGVNTFKTDFGERIPTNVVYHNGADSRKMHNYYTYLYNEVVFNTVKRLLGNKEAVVFARSATVGSQKFPVHWGGDNTPTFASMAESLRGGLSFTLSGFGFWSHDISGFEDKTTPELYRRWSQFGFLSTHTRYHGNIEYKVPWLYGDQSVKVASKFSKLKNRLMPYLFSSACQTAQTGVPMMRAMILEFLDDYATHTLDRQYMLGDNLLVAPIFNEVGRADYYLPKGIWTNILTNQIKEGGSWQHEDFDELTFPLLARPNSMIVMGLQEYTADYDYTKDIEIHAYAIDNNAAISTLIYNNQGEKKAEITLICQDSTITLNHSGLCGSLSLVLHKLVVKAVEGGELSQDGDNSIISIKEEKITLKV